MKRPILATLFATATGASMAAVTLVPTLTAPAELQLGEYEVYRLSVRNSGSTNTTGVVVRMNVPIGMVPVGPLPPICMMNTNPQELVCATGSVPARKSRDYAIVFQAPNATQVFSHRLVATGAGAAAATSAPAITDYRHFDIPFAGSSTQLWEVRSCGGSSPIAYSLCPSSSEVVGDAILQVGGNFEDLLYGSPGTWLQNAPHDLRWDSPAIPGVQDAHFANLTAVNSICFRGPGQTLPTPGSGNPIWYTASKICKK